MGFLGSPNSHNHVFLCGGIEDWMWTQLAGLKPTSPGFATIAIAPRIDPSVGPSSLQAIFSSPAGDIVVQWKRSRATQTAWLLLAVPIGVQSALVSMPLPFEGQSRVTEGGVLVWSG